MACFIFSLSLLRVRVQIASHGFRVSPSLTPWSTGNLEKTDKLNIKIKHLYTLWSFKMPCSLWMWENRSMKRWMEPVFFPCWFAMWMYRFFELVDSARAKFPHFILPALKALATIWLYIVLILTYISHNHLFILMEEEKKEKKVMKGWRWSVNSSLRWHLFSHLSTVWWP